jgi:hypothetical protein
MMTPFEFMACSELIQILGIRVADEKALADSLADAPLDSVYYHTHGHLLRHGFVGAPYSNDFATWAAMQVRDRVLGERLAAVSPLDFRDLEEMREELVCIIDDHLSQLPIIPRVVFGEPFDFIQSRVVEVPTGFVAHDLLGLRDALLRLPPSGLYFHLVEVRVRRRGQPGDLIGWVRGDLARPVLAAALGRIDPHLIGLERMRSEVLRLCDEALAAEGSGGGTTP